MTNKPETIAIDADAAAKVRARAELMLAAGYGKDQFEDLCRSVAALLEQKGT